MAVLRVYTIGQDWSGVQEGADTGPLSEAAGTRLSSEHLGHLSGGIKIAFKVTVSKGCKVLSESDVSAGGCKSLRYSLWRLKSAF